ncbi:hypothetical protein AB205_0111040 [Aquarana catesbeiana]|uniref:Uncharacterized protein n=1 Tax=Aquarana catesbeiana TaxID=8400 RepID=A0A2G9RR24_AQUCT|nr:hypothetical protein AB205_0111040 [Aquarana catesbeiana]
MASPAWPPLRTLLILRRSVLALQSPLTFRFCVPMLHTTCHLASCSFPDPACLPAAPCCTSDVT